MKSIIDKLKESLESVIGDGRFFYNDGEGLNIDLDSANFPCAFAQLTETGALQDSLGQFHERISIGLFFADIADIEMEPMSNERILTQLKSSALTWLSSMTNNDALRLVEVRSTDRVYIKNSDFDVRVTAYVVNVTLEEIQGFGKCPINSCNCE